MRRWLVWILIFGFGLSWGPISGCSCGTVGGLALVSTSLPNNQLVFLDTNVGEVGTLTFKLFNDSVVPLQIERIEVVDDSAGVFSLGSKLSLPIELQGGAAAGITLSVKFAPKALKAYKAKLHIVSGNADNVDATGAFAVELRGEIPSYKLSWSCAGELDFGQVKAGEESIKTCELRNVGSRKIRLAKATYTKQSGSDDAYLWLLPKFSVELAPKGELFVRVRYKPSLSSNSTKDEGAFFLEVAGLQPNETPPQLIVKGKVQASSVFEFVYLEHSCSKDHDCKPIHPDLICSSEQKQHCAPAPEIAPMLVMEDVGLGETTTASFALRSSGSSPVEVTGLSVVGSTKEFQVIEPKTFPVFLSPKEERTVTVRYAPTDGGTHSAELKVASNGKGTQGEVIRLVPTQPVCVLKYSSKALTFSKADELQVVDIQNVGKAACTFSNIRIEDSNPSTYRLESKPQVPFVLKPNADLKLSVRFVPGNQTSFEANLLLSTNLSSQPVQRIRLSAPTFQPQTCILQLSEQVLDFGAVSEGALKTLSVTLKNLGSGLCRFQSIGLSSQNKGFSIQSGLPLTQLVSGEEATLVVQFTPLQINTRVIDRLEIVSPDNATSTMVVQLQGSGVPYCLGVLPDKLDLGGSNVGCKAASQKITFFHTGEQGCPDPIVLQSIAPVGGTSSAFSVVGANQVSLKPGEAKAVELTFKPTKVGVVKEPLRMTTNIPSQTQWDIPMVAEGVSQTTQNDVYQQPNKVKSDVLFVIDSSGSMADDQAMLASNTTYFLNWATRLNVDYSVMVITMDASGQPFPKGCAFGTTKVISPKTPNPNQTLNNNFRVGTSGSGLEQGLESAYRALSPARLNDPKCNKGFLRPDANLSIIFLSDEPDGSPFQASFYTSFFKSLKANQPLATVTASVIGGPPPSGCRSSTVIASAMPRYWKVSQDLNGVQASLCDHQWRQTLDSIVAKSWAYPTAFRVRREPKPSTLKVRVNGVIIPESATNGWQYNKNDSMIQFSPGQVPKPGATVSLSYEPICKP